MHFGFSNIGSKVHRFSSSAIYFWQFSTGTPCTFFSIFSIQLIVYNLIGGSNGRGAILDVTRGHFSDGFIGCLRTVTIQNIEVFTQIEEISGKNIRSCSDQDDGSSDLAWKK